MYPTYYQDRVDHWKQTGARQATVSKDYEVHDVLLHQLPETVRRILSSVAAADTLKITGSDGASIITPGPWVNIRIPQLAAKTTEGFYPVYLFSLDMTRIYLALALGTQIFAEKNLGDDSILTAGRMLRDRILPLAFDVYDIREDARFIAGKLDLAVSQWTDEHGRKPRNPAKYEYANIFALEYSADDLPENDILEQDLILFTEIYGYLATIPEFPVPVNLVVSDRDKAEPPAISSHQAPQTSWPGIPSNVIPPTAGQTLTTRSEPRLTRSNIYFARFGETDFYKIGRGRNPKARLSEFNAHIPNRDNEIPTIGRWELVDTVPLNSEWDAHEMEIDTHSWLKEFRTHRERFHCTEARIQEAIVRLRRLIGS
tara:strand:- start:1288 stop:2400 length:1113 start_codon:yes stop_codon:yes gene_type:complete